MWEHRFDYVRHYDEVKRSITVAANEAGRDASDVKLIAVSKGQPSEAIHTVYALGQRDFGESFVNELVQKRETLLSACPEIRWHFIGKIQTNKIAKIADVFCVHSVARVREAEMLALANSKSLRICLQVNIGREPQKNGVMPEQSFGVAKEILSLGNAPALVGLMTIPPVADKSQTQDYFSELRKLRDELQQKLSRPLPELSMGMSEDFALAIKEGATWVRVGTALFGPRM